MFEKVELPPIQEYEKDDKKVDHPCIGCVGVSDTTVCLSLGNTCINERIIWIKRSH